MGRDLRFRRAVIATGGRAATPPIPGIEAVPVPHERNGLRPDGPAAAADRPRRRPHRLRTGPGLRPVGIDRHPRRPEHTGPAARGPGRRRPRRGVARPGRRAACAWRADPRRAPRRRRRASRCACRVRRMRQRRPSPATRCWWPLAVRRTSRISAWTPPEYGSSRRAWSSTIVCGRPTAASTRPATCARRTSSRTPPTRSRASCCRMRCSSDAGVRAG